MPRSCSRRRQSVAVGVVHRSRRMGSVPILSHFATLSPTWTAILMPPSCEVWTSCAQLVQILACASTLTTEAHACTDGVCVNTTGFRAAGGSTRRVSTDRITPRDVQRPRHTPASGHHGWRSARGDSERTGHVGTNAKPTRSDRRRTAPSRGCRSRQRERRGATSIGFGRHRCRRRAGQSRAGGTGAGPG